MKTKKQIEKKIDELSDYGFYLMSSRSLFRSNMKQMIIVDAKIKSLQWVLNQTKEEL